MSCSNENNILLAKLFQEAKDSIHNIGRTDDVVIYVWIGSVDDTGMEVGSFKHASLKQLYGRDFILRTNQQSKIEIFYNDVIFDSKTLKYVTKD